MLLDDRKKEAFVTLNILEDEYSMEVEDGDFILNNPHKIESLGSYDRKIQEDDIVPPENLTRKAVETCILRRDISSEKTGDVPEERAGHAGDVQEAAAGQTRDVFKIYRHLSQ